MGLDSVMAGLGIANAPLGEVAAASPLKGARLKSDRANQHVSAFIAELRAFRQRDPYRVVVEYDPPTGKKVWAFRVHERPPRILPAIAGDAIHNLRAALDVGYTEIRHVLGHPPAQGDRRHFPIGASRDDLEKLLSSEGHVNAVSKNIVDVVRGLEPYQSGAGHVLWCLHAAEVADKHYSVVRIKHTPVFPATQFSRQDGSFLMIQGGPVEDVEDGAHMDRFPAPTEINVGEHLKLPPHVEFTETSGLEQIDVLTFLVQSLQYVHRSLEALEALAA
jgi:hypothetical protein